MVFSTFSRLLLTFHVVGNCELTLNTKPIIHNNRVMTDPNVAQSTIGTLNVYDIETSHYQKQTYL